AKNADGRSVVIDGLTDILNKLTLEDSPPPDTSDFTYQVIAGGVLAATTFAVSWCCISHRMKTRRLGNDSPKNIQGSEDADLNHSAVVGDSLTISPPALNEDLTKRFKSVRLVLTPARQADLESKPFCKELLQYNGSIILYILFCYAELKGPFPDYDFAILHNTILLYQALEKLLGARPSFDNLTDAVSLMQSDKMRKTLSYERFVKALQTYNSISEKDQKSKSKQHNKPQSQEEYIKVLEKVIKNGIKQISDSRKQKKPKK
ncbi:MAG: hypothetical protein AB7R69_05120, partial [Candidatus Babeliales bacterium]